MDSSNCRYIAEEARCKGSDVAVDSDGLPLRVPPCQDAPVKETVLPYRMF